LARYIFGPRRLRRALSSSMGFGMGSPPRKAMFLFVVLRLRYVLERQVNFVYFIFACALCANASQLYSRY
jgi:hypothetical protein